MVFFISNLFVLIDLNTRSAGGNELICFNYCLMAFLSFSVLSDGFLSVLSILLRFSRDSFAIHFMSPGTGVTAAEIRRQSSSSNERHWGCQGIPRSEYSRISSSFLSVDDNWTGFLEARPKRC